MYYLLKSRICSRLTSKTNLVPMSTSSNNLCKLQVLLAI